MRTFFLLLLSVNMLIVNAQVDFAIYHDNGIGAWADGVIAFEHFLTWKGVSHKRVTAHDINTVSLKEFYKAIYFPGGDADYYNADINATGIKNIQELIANNGAYIGMCAGAEFACDKLVWEGIAYDYPLNLFQGVSVGPIDELAVWPSYAMITLSMCLDNEINKFEPTKEDMLYWGGSVFEPYNDAVFDTIATFDGFNNRPAIVSFTYGDGRVLLISPHPEIEENSNRDNVNVAQELDDNGSDWNFLWTATDWLLGNPLTNPSGLKVPVESSKGRLYIYPNPTKGILNIAFDGNHGTNKVVIYNSMGCVIKERVLENGCVDVSDLNSGIYIIEVEINGEKLHEKLVMEN